MKKRMIRTFVAISMVTVLLAGMTVTVSAANPDYSKEIEATSNWLDGLTLSPGSGSSKPTTPTPDAAQTNTKLTADELKAYADKVFESVNKEREKAGVPTLERDSRLDEAAAVRAKEIQSAYDKYGTCHRRLDGENFKDIFSEYGISVSSWGENAACRVKSPGNVMSAWMKSEGHKANILKAKYTQIGIGIYQHPNGTLDWVQLFMKEK